MPMPFKLITSHANAVREGLVRRLGREPTHDEICRLTKLSLLLYAKPEEIRSEDIPDIDDILDATPQNPPTMNGGDVLPRFEFPKKRRRNYPSLA